LVVVLVLVVAMPHERKECSDESELEEAEGSTKEEVI
jgi:hypothetical protein